MVYGCLLDCSKAFDTVEHSKLFQKLLDAKMPKIIVRMMTSIYRRQTANVRWKGQLSEEFPIRNGVRQGAVISPILFSFYMDNLFNILKSSGSGCFIGKYNAGCAGYADDLLFLCPTRGGLQDMLDIAQKYVEEHNITFSTNTDPIKSKTKGIVFSKSPLNFNPAPLKLNGTPLPWIDHAKYLGNTITSVPDGFCKDAKEKRARYIERNCEIMQEFPMAHPEVKCNINRIYNSSFPGSVLYDLSSTPATQLKNSWSVSTRHMWGLPLHAHRYLIEELGGQHAQSMMILRYVKFLQSITRSPKNCVQFLLHKVIGNAESITGKNVAFIMRKTRFKFDLLTVAPNMLKNKLKFSELHENNIWRVNMIREITNIKQGVLTLDEGSATQNWMN